MVKLSQLRLPTGFSMKKKVKTVGGGNNKNNFNAGGDGEKKKEKDPSKIQDRVQQKTLKQLELENTEEHGIAIQDLSRLTEIKITQMQGLSGNDDDNNGGGGGKNNKKGSDRDGDGNGDKYNSDRDSDSGGEMKGKNMDFMGKAGFGYKYGYHAGNENEYPVGQLQCAQEVTIIRFQMLVLSCNYD